jgi:outer membrane protein W
MKNIKAILIAALFSILSSFSFAQGGGLWNFQWDMGFGMGDTKTFVDGAPSFRGASIEGRSYVTDNITLGGRVSWNTFYKNFGRVTRTQGTTTLTGYNKRYINDIPILFTGHYYFNSATVMPYIGLGIGTYYIETRDQMGIYYIEDKAWHFGLAPEVGVVVPFGNSNTGATVNFRYNTAFKTKDTSAQSWLGISVGISYLF